jgi:flagellar brake protein
MTIASIQPEDSQRYSVTHAHSIERILTDIMETRAVVSLYADVAHGQDFALSSIVAIEPAKEFLFLEQGVDQDLNRRLINTGSVVCGTTHQQVHIQFTGNHLKPVMRGKESVFQVAIPKELLRLQRRDTYRLATSVINPVKCLINTGTSFLDAIVVDISIGGVGILAYEGINLLKTGATYHGCRIELPGSGTFAVSLNVCTTFDVELKNGRLTHRAGCQFMDLPPSVETEIQRYIIRVERERRARYT